MGPQYKKCIAQYKKKKKKRSTLIKQIYILKFGTPKTKDVLPNTEKYKKHIKLKIKNISWKLDPQYKKCIAQNKNIKKHEKHTNI